MPNPNHAIKKAKLENKRRSRNYFTVFLPTIIGVGAAIYIIVTSIMDLF